jgi:hypothetical protein
MSLRKIIGSVLTVCGIACLAACAGQDICLSNQHAVQVSLLSVYSKTDKDTSLAISAVGLGRQDSVYSNDNLSQLFLPLSFEQEPDTTSFLVQFNKTIDTLHFIHRKKLDFVSGECGYVFRFTLDSIWFSRNTLDSAIIIYPTIQYGEDATNVKLFVY